MATTTTMDDTTSQTTVQSEGVEQSAVQTTDATAETHRISMQRVQNVILIWLDRKINVNSTSYRRIITQLRRIANGVNTFTDDQECIQFIDKTTDNKIFIIIEDSLGQDIMPRIHNMSQVDSIFIFCDNRQQHEEWTTDWSKIKGVFTEISSVCEALKQMVQQCEQNAISISFVATDGDISKKNLDQLDPIFMYSQILKEILLTIKFDDGHIKEFLDHCRDVFADNDQKLKNVAKLQKKYRSKTPIWWYTSESFLYTMLNCALRLMDMNIIIKMGFFTSDLHRHIERLHSEQFIENNSRQVFTVYRGQGMSKIDFDQMTKTQGGLMSFNNFLSTSEDPQTSLLFAENNEENSNLIGILFTITIDLTESTTPFASIGDVEHYGDNDNEVLFSMHAVFRIGEITPMDENLCVFKVQLTLASDNDNDIRVLTDRIRQDTFPEEEGWYRLGSLLLKVGEFAKAQQIYEILLEQTTDMGERGRIFHQLGTIKNRQGEYNEAITFYEKALEIYKETLSPADLNLAHCYNNIGLVCFNMGDYPKALSSHEKALEIKQVSLPFDHPDVGSSHNNIGNVYRKMGDYRKALSSHEKALEIRKQSLPENHPDLGSSYVNIGNVYYNMGNFPKALSYYEKALEIKQQSLPSNHPDLGMSYNNIGTVYFNMSDYPKALASHEKALQIRKKSLPSNHPDLGSSYNNIGEVYFKMGNYTNALSSHEKALEIQQQTLPSNHPSISISCGHIGNVYRNMGEPLKARWYCQHAVDIAEQSLPPNHSHIQWHRNNLDLVKRQCTF